MTFRHNFLFLFSAIFFTALAVPAQIGSALGQVTNSGAESFAGGISGDGRFVVFESRGDLATENPRNADGNVEIFLFDYAQRRIFQITDTKSVLYDDRAAAVFSNIRVEIINTRPVISNDGKWIAFSSNATTARPTAPNATNPGSFDGNSFTSPTPTPTPSPSPTATPSPTPTPSVTPTPSPTPTPGANPLTQDGNLEMWMYQIPTYAPVANLSTGDEIPFVNLAGGTFVRVTNTDASQLPKAATTTVGAFVADDNHDASISDDGSRIAFVSTRDLVTCVGNSFAANEDNDEIFTYTRGGTASCTDGTGVGLRQVTKTPRGNFANPIYNKNVTIAGNGARLVFASTGENPVVGMTGGNNPSTSRNEEIVFTDLDATGAPAGTRKQVTTTTPTNAGDVLNVLDLGRRMSRDGRFIAFESYADLANENSNTNYTSFALYLYDTTTSTFRRIGPRSDADSTASGGDIQHYPGFTDYDANGVAQTLVLSTRLNIKADGTVPTTSSEGLNDSPVRPTQIYSYPLNVAASSATFTRLNKFPIPGSFIASTQVIPSNSIRRVSFNAALTEFGTGNQDGQSEVYYLLQPQVINQATVTVNVKTGASGQPVTILSPTPTPTGTPTATPTPSPSPTGSPTPTPTPVTPAAVLGVSPGMLTIMDYQPGFDRPIVTRSAQGSFDRRFNLPIELSGLTLTIDGVACGLKEVSANRIVFVAPPFIGSVAAGTNYPMVINNNGTVMNHNVTIVPTRPDIFNMAGTPTPGGRAKLFNVTNRVFTTEPFAVRTVKIKGGVFVPSRLRLYMTGIANVSASLISIRIKDKTIFGTLADPVPIEPGVYTIDFNLPPETAGLGDSPVVVTVTIDTNTSFSSRLDDTTSFVYIL